MAQSPNTDVDPKEYAASRQTWLGFTSLVKYGTISVAAILLLMLLFIY